MSVIKSVDVWGACGEFGFSERAWRLVLALGCQYGWRPAGTLPPDEEACIDDWHGDPAAWDGRYFPPICQRITEADAWRLAAALERALADLPDHWALTQKMIPRPASPTDDPLWDLEPRPSAVISPLELFSGPNKLRLRDFIAHCRECAELWVC